jgi:nitrite reductase/ring-hydroxylating ferredoxin subunit
MAEFVRVAGKDELLPGQGKAVSVNGKSIALFNVKGEFFAVDDYCTHKGAPLHNGMLGNNSITCEWHGATFDLKTGAVLSPPAAGGITAYEVRVNGDDVEILL